MSVEQFLIDHNIPYITEGGHATKEWVNIHCPFCTGSKAFHLGITDNFEGCHCWRCGGHSTIETLGKVLDLPYAEIRRMIEKYKDSSIGIIKRVIEPKVSIHPFKFPKPNFALNKYGKKYLLKRGFDPDYLVQEWGLLQTGPVSFLDKISYNNRILIPIYWDNKIVSFQSRDITGKSDKRYLACPMKREEKHHKTILYGKQEYWIKSKGIIIVEGPADVWRFGGVAAATFGIVFKTEQILQLAKHNDRFFIVFDNESQAQDQARKLAIKLKTLGKKVQIEKVLDDPGNMKQEDADYFVKELIGKND